MRTVNRPGNEIVVMANDVDEFMEFRSHLPYHETASFMVTETGAVKALMKPLPNIVPINRKYFVSAQA